MAGLRWTAARLLAAAGLLATVDRARRALALRQAGRRNAAFLAAHPGLAPPPVELAWDAWNHVDWRIWDDTGAAHARVLAEALARHAPPVPLAVLEWGCGCARITRHLRAALGVRAGRLVAADADARAVDWCRAQSAALAGIEFVAHAPQPPLPFADAGFDVVLGFSVLTHLSERSARAWTADLARVLRPGGLVLLTTHGRGQRALLSRAERRRFDAGQIVVQAWAPEGRKWFLAHHPESAVRTRLLADFEVLEHLPGARGEAFPQDLWIARRRAASATR